MSDENKDRDLDADILQGKADILEALRAAGKAVPNEPDTGSDELVEESLDDLDILDIKDDETGIVYPEEVGPDEAILQPSEGETAESIPAGVISFEETQQNNGSAEVPETPTAESIDTSETPAASDGHKKTFQRDVRQLESRISTLMEENERLNADLKDHFQTASQTQRLRFELSETEVALSRERSNIRMLETKLNEIEGLKALLEQDCHSLSEKLEALEQEKQQLSDNFKNLHNEHSDYREKTGREVVDLNKQIERMTDDSDVLKNNLSKLRQELENSQAEARSGIEQLTQQRDALGQEKDSLQQTTSELNQQISGLREKEDALSQLQQQFESVQQELNETQSMLSQEQNLCTELKQDIEKLRATSEENDNVQQQLRVDTESYKSEAQHLNAELSALREKFEQERGGFSERIGQMSQEKQELQDALEQTRAELAGAQEQGSQDVNSLNEQIQQLSSESNALKETYEQIRHEYEAHQTQTEGEIAHLAEEREMLQNETDLLRCSLSELQQEAEAHKLNAEALSHARQQIEHLSTEHQKFKELHEQTSSAAEENEMLQKHVAELQTQKGELAETLSGLREQFDHTQTSKQAQFDEFQKQADQFEQQLKCLDEMRVSLQQSQDESARLRDGNEELHEKLVHLESQLRTYTDTEIAISSGSDVTKPSEMVSEAMQEEAPPQVPVYNLAEQIMSEQRRVIGSRRQRVEPAAAGSKSESIKDVVKHYVGEPARPVETKTSYYDLWNDDSLTAFQRELLQEITQKDILKYCEN